MLSDWQKACYTTGFVERNRMPARAAKPVRASSEERKRAQRIFARLVGGESIRAIATSENLSVRRVPQIVRD